MVGSSSEESGVGRSLEGMSNGQQLSGEALSEWRCSEQVENGITSTSPPYWDTDDGEDCGLKPSELYGKYTWKIDKFSHINKRELRSNAFEVGGYKWYILIYPQGCDVCNHLSLFLCVANHDKLLPGWSHFAQFTIAVVNKDPKKSKYSDTLHRFWRKEHDWGWKKFMELSKVLDGFVDTDTLIIKAQVQVIRERADRPFRCLDCPYRRELVRVYLSNVEQICRCAVEERRGRLGKLIEDKVRWSSLCSFWLGIDENERRYMSMEKSELILKVAVKQFFIEKEVTSTLVMDSLYSGLKALEGQSKKTEGGEPLPIVRVEKDSFILVDDILLLLERTALEPLPPKDEKGHQNRTKDCGSGEDFSKDSIERDERRLTELGRRTIEIFVLAHIFSSKIDIAYQEAVALKRQEELIREEEAAWMSGVEQKAKRKSKKKQGKQKRSNNRKVKEKGKEEKAGSAVVEETLIQPPAYSDDRTSPPMNWDTDTPTKAANSVSSDMPLNNGESHSSSSSATVMDDSSSSTDSSVPDKGHKTHNSPTRGKDKKVDKESDVVVVSSSLQDRMKWVQQQMEKEAVNLKTPAIARKPPASETEKANSRTQEKPVVVHQSAPFLSRSVSADDQSYRNPSDSFKPQTGFMMMLNDIQNPPDEFPHLDIINDLLDDDATEVQKPSHQLTRHLSYPNSNSCRSERIQSFQHGCYDFSRETMMMMMVPHEPYMNGQHISHNHWHHQQHQHHLSYLSLRNIENDDGYQYHHPNYANLMAGLNDASYTLYPPPNGY